MTMRPVLVYIFSIAAEPSAVGAKNFLSLSNPPGSSVVVALGGVFLSSIALGAVSVSTPLRGYRTNVAAGGSLVTASQVAKFSALYPDHAAEVRTGDPTATLGPPFFNSPPVVATGLGSSSVHEVSPPSGLPFLLFPGEGMVLRSEAGDTDLSWNISVVWSERR